MDVLVTLFATLSHTFLGKAAYYFAILYLDVAVFAYRLAT
jgi:hypothetical protein